eukprot:scaffold94848_cov65-Phaeocystis_antarctica.AAC.6
MREIKLLGTKGQMCTHVSQSLSSTSYTITSGTLQPRRAPTFSRFGPVPTSIFCFASPVPPARSASTPPSPPQAPG